MRALAVRTLAIVALLLSCVATASAQTTLTRWNFNALTGPLTPVVGTGTSGGYGQGAPAAPLSSIVYQGTLVDSGTVITGTTFNRALTVNPPLLSAPDDTVGVWFSAPTTGMQPGEQVKLSWSQTVGFRSSRYWQVLLSATGSGTAGFSVPSGATGSSISQFVSGYNTGSSSISGTATVNVSSTGLIDFRTIGGGTTGNFLSPAVTTTSGTTWPNPLAAGFVDNISITLPTGQGYENNANFAFAIVASFDPSLSAVSGTTGYVSSFAGTDSLDTSMGYNRAVNSGGSMRLDLVTVSAVPEPTTFALLGTSALIGGSIAWRRRRRTGDEA